MVESLAITAEMIDGVERRTVHLTCAPMPKPWRQKRDPRPPSEADKAAWRWYEIDRSQRIGAAIVAKYDLDPGLLRALKDAHEDDDSGVALDALLDIAEAAIKKRDEGAS